MPLSAEINYQWKEVKFMLTMIKNLWKEERGQGMTEYGLILALLVIGVIAVLVVMGPKLVAQFQKVSDTLPAAP
jgi:pilus assembly protein Flp/PilA